MNQIQTDGAHAQRNSMVNIIPAPVEVPIDAGFDPEIDILGRKPFGESLTRLVQALPDGGVIALDSAWGEGKSTFIKMWLGHLRKEEPDPIESIYLDAFEHDYSDDPFICLSAELLSFFKGKTGSLSGLKDAGIALGKGILKTGTNIVIKLATINAADGTIFDQVETDIDQALSGIADKEIWARMEAQQNLKTSITNFRKKLEKEVLEQANGKLIFVIDELDRCRPDFAVAMVEQVKHLFAAKGVVFVLVLNSEQLQESVKGVYGQGIKADLYLQKFINIWVSLPPKMEKSEGRTTEYQIFIRHLLNKTGLPNAHIGRTGVSHNTLVEYIEQLAEKYQLSLRALEKVVSNVAMTYVVLDSKVITDPVAVVMLATIKVFKPEIFDDLLYKKTRLPEDTLLALGFDPQNTNPPNIFATTLMYMISDSEQWQAFYHRASITNQMTMFHYDQVRQAFNQRRGIVFLKAYAQAMSQFLTA